VATVIAAVLVVGGLAGAAIVLGGDSGAEETSATATRGVRPLPSVSVAGTSVSTLPAHPCRAPLTPSAPLRLWIAGDSIAFSVGNGLGKRAASTGVVAPVYESRVSSGLASPGFFDWPQRVATELPRLDPEVVVFVMGTNDWAVPQPTPTDASGQPTWKARYAQTVQGMVDALTAGGRTLYWVGPPVLRDPKQEAGARQVASVIREVVARDADALYVDAHDLLDTEDGAYTATVEVDGKRIQARTSDGVHFTPDGGDYLGNAIFAALDAQCRLKAQAVPDAKQPVIETQGSTSVAPGSTATAPPVVTNPVSVATTAPPAAPSTTQAPTSSTTTSTPDTTAPTLPTTVTTAGG
jgi:hypothetical protein